MCLYWYIHGTILGARGSEDLCGMGISGCDYPGTSYGGRDCQSPSYESSQVPGEGSLSVSTANGMVPQERSQTAHAPNVASKQLGTNGVPYSSVTGKYMSVTSCCSTVAEGPSCNSTEPP